MTQLVLPLCLASLVLVFTSAATIPPDHAEVDGRDVAVPDRCAGIEFDAITPDEAGNQLFFKDGYLWKGFRGPPQLISESFSHVGHVDAAFRMHRMGNPAEHDHVYLFQNEKVFRYYNQSLQEGYPKMIKEEFPGVSCHLDAAVECPLGACSADSILFFKGSEVFHYDIATRTAKTKVWPSVPACTSAFSWVGHYYCFQGNNFTSFNPSTGVVAGAYPKDARHYFMSCPLFGHGGESKLPGCAEIKVDAVTSDDMGKTYIFMGPYYTRHDTGRDGMHWFPVGRMWPEVARGVDAVFSQADRMYFIKGDQVFIYRTGAHYTLIEGYPKSLQEELGLEGPVDAAYSCQGQTTVHVIQGNKMVDVDLSATPRAVTSEGPLVHAKVDGALCGPKGVQLFVNAAYYEYADPGQVRDQGLTNDPKPITPDMVACKA